MSNNGQATETDTTVTLLPSTEVKGLHSMEAAFLVQHLETLGGDISKFVKTITDGTVPAELVIFYCEKALAELEDKSLYKRWEASIRLRKVSRLRVLQEKAFTALEEAANDLSVSPKNALDFSKVILQEFLSSQAIASKNALNVKELEKDNDDEFEKELMEMEELGK